jgi:antibiotic biosynthesis monooxygenase (ABM) superfamily enzyme
VAEPVTVTVARQVAPGRETEFEDWADRLTAAAARYHGFLGAGLLRPGRLGEDWHVVYRFDSPAHLDEWQRSPARARLLAEGEAVMRTTGTSRITGLETWFALPGRTAPAPPRWKMFLVTAAGQYPLQVAVYALLGALAAGWPTILRLALFVPLVAASMTWLVMPRAARFLEHWLYPGRRDSAGREASLPETREPTDGRG